MYSARISRKTPALFVILIDQSGSMEEPTTLYGKSVSKAEAVATTVNMLIGECCIEVVGKRDTGIISI